MYCAVEDCCEDAEITCCRCELDFCKQHIHNVAYKYYCGKCAAMLGIKVGVNTVVKTVDYTFKAIRWLGSLWGS